MSTSQQQNSTEPASHPGATRVRIFDTTLRDGEQSPGASMNMVEKLEMARALAALGVDVIEAGFPIASVGDFEAVRAIAAVTDRFGNCRVEAELGQGSLSTVYRAVQEPLGRVVAIKALKSSISTTSSFARELEHEAAMLSEVRSRAPQILTAIRDQREIKADTEKELVSFLDGFAKTFA